MFAKVIGGFATAGVLAGVLATGAMAAPSGTAAAAPKQQAAKDVFGGVVTAISEKQLTVKNPKAGSKTFLRTDTTIVTKGRAEKASWSEIEVNSRVQVRFAECDGKLYANRVHIGRARVAGIVSSIKGNQISIKTRDGKEIRLTLSDQTKFVEITGKKQRQPGKLSDIHVGTRLLAAGSYDSAHNFDAARIAYRNK